MEEALESSHEQSTGLERLVFFSDAVFAIVITLLVLPLTAEIDLPEPSQSLAQLVEDLWPRMISFLVSFLVIGQFWIAHHHMFGKVRHFDQGLLWFNLVSLLTISFMPFPTAVLGSRVEADEPFPVVFYAASLAVSSLALTTTWLYAVRRQLVDPGMNDQAVRAFTARAITTSAIFLLSMGAAFLGLWVAVACWLVLLPLGRLVIGRVQAPRQNSI
ncbi:TMEM175 family protein [Microlunatus panaciterrae]|nr:TMEM175 family protein [Microlunatus panaciterrae]